MTRLARAVGLAVACAAVRSARAELPARETYALPNGLTVVLAPDRDVANVAVEAWYAPGTDGDARAELVERLAFRGSKHVGDGKAEAWIEDAGGWTDVRAARDHTAATTVVPAGALALALQLEAERMAGLADAFDAARVGEAIAATARDRDARATERAIAAAVGHNATPPAAPDARALAAWYRAHYTPAATTLVICGNFDAATARALVAKDFGWMPRTAVVQAPASAVAQATERAARPGALALVDPNTPAPALVLAYALPPASSPDTAALQVAAFVLGDGRAPLLAQFAAEVRTRLEPGQLTIELVGVTAEPARVLAEIGRLRAGTLAPDDVPGARATLDTRFVESLENLAFRADAFARFAVLHAPAGADPIAATRAALAAVDDAAVARVAATYLADDAAVVATVAKAAP